MNIKATTKYQLREYKKSLGSYYLIVLLIVVLFTVLDRMWGSEGSGSYNGFEFATIIFLFICGLNSFKGTFLMMMQNGISRKSMFIGASITFLSVSMLMSVIDRVIAMVVDLITKAIGGLSYEGFYDLVYSHRMPKGILFELEGILVTCAMYAAAVTAGYFITTLYYRMNKALKVIVSVGVPVTLFFILPLVDSMFFNGIIGDLVLKLFYFIFGDFHGKANPYNMLLVCIISSIIALGLSWLLVKRAVDKN